MLQGCCWRKTRGCRAVAGTGREVAGLLLAQNAKLQICCWRKTRGCRTVAGARREVADRAVAGARCEVAELLLAQDKRLQSCCWRKTRGCRSSCCWRKTRGCRLSCCWRKTQGCRAVAGARRKVAELLLAQGADSRLGGTSERSLYAPGWLAPSRTARWQSCCWHRAPTSTTGTRTGDRRYTCCRWRTAWTPPPSCWTTGLTWRPRTWRVEPHCTSPPGRGTSPW